MMTDSGDDLVVACADLVNRAGGIDFEIGYVREDVPIEDAGWYAMASWRGTRVIADEKSSPGEAALGLAQRILGGGVCRCGRPVSLSDTVTGCRWRLMGNHWQPGCNRPSIDVTGSQRGDLPAMGRALAETLTRREADQTRRERRNQRGNGRR